MGGPTSFPIPVASAQQGVDQGTPDAWFGPPWSARCQPRPGRGRSRRRAAAPVSHTPPAGKPRPSRASWYPDRTPPEPPSRSAIRSRVEPGKAPAPGPGPRPRCPRADEVAPLGPRRPIGCVGPGSDPRRRPVQGPVAGPGIRRVDRRAPPGPGARARRPGPGTTTPGRQPGRCASCTASPRPSASDGPAPGDAP